ncbi:Ig-like domain-containing protein [Gallibacterium anatis]|uniref:Ig-like domain-containing protein n=1 Tax=Gallibacterium anatis TaxID=750 RepID=UPI0030065D02
MVRGGGSSAHSAPSDTTPPSQPTDVVIKNDGKQITGKAEPGSKITIKDDQGNVIANGKADEQGNFSIDLNPPKNNGEKVEVTATDNAGNTSTPTDVIASDSTPPAKPKNLDVSDDGTRVTGTAEPGSTVTVKDENGKEIGTATAGDDGKFDVTINPPKTNGEELTVEAKDEAGNPSQPNTVKADDSTPPAKPENLGVSDDGTRVTGTAEPGSTVTVKDEKDNVIGTGKANEEDGKFDITLDEPKTALEELSVTATDNANNESNSEKVTAPLVVPKTKPDFDYAVPVAGVDKLYNAKEVGTDGTITVKVIPNANIGDSVSITRDGKTEVFKITTDNKNGIEVEVKPGSEISAFIIGANGVAGEIASQTLQNADVDVPNVKPIITFESTGTDNIYNIEEVKRGKPNTITATVKFPDAREGDIVVVNGQKTRITTENLISGVEVEVEPNTEVKAYIKDDAGNQGFISTSIAPKADLEKPDAPIKVDVASDNSPADNVLTRNEINKHGEVPVRVYLPQGLEEGDKLIVTPSTKKGSPIEHPLTKAEIDQGYAIVDAPTGVDALGQGKVSFTAQLIDKAGNSSTEKDSDNYDVKRALLGKPSVEYPDDKDNNQVLLGEELAGNTTSVKINLPNIGEGDTVSITINGEEYGVDVITQKVTHNDKTFEFKPATDDDGYTVTINDISIADGSVSEVVTNVVVTANNTELKADGTVRIDRSQPGGRDNNGDAKGDDKPTLEIPEAVNPSLEKDGNINAQELSDGVVAKVTLPEGVQAGDVIVIKNNGQELYTYTIPQGTTTTKGSVIEFSIPKEKLPSGAYELSASVKEPDSYGDKARESEDSNTIAFKVDNKIPGDSNGDGVVNGSDENSGQPIVTVTDAHTTEGQDKPVGNKDLENGIQVEVTIPKGTEAGDTVEVTVKTPNGEVKKTAKVEEGDLPENGDGKVTVTVPTKDLQDNNGKVPDGDYSVTAVVTDPAGNSSATSDETKFTVDTTAPGDSNGDGKVDRDDKNGGKPVVAVPEATDADGNTINAGDLKDGVQVEVTLPGGVAAGDVVTLEVKTPNSNDPIKVTKTLESGDITAGKVTVDIPKADLPKDSDGKVDGAYQVTATVSDKAGNTSLVSDAKGFTIDATVPGDTNGDGKADTNDINGKPSVSIPEDTDGGVTATEFNDGVQVKVTLPAGTQEGDTITLTVTPKGGEAFTVISAISDSDLSTETATVTIPKDQFPETPKGDYTVSAQIKDAAGNQSLPSVKKTFTVLDTVVPGDTNGDGEADADGKPNVLVVDAHTSDNQDKPVGSDDLKDGVQVEVTLPKGTEVGDTVTVTMTKPDGSTVTATGTVAKGDLPGTGDGKVTVTVPNKQFPTDEKGKITEGEYKVTATVKDADGNTSQPSDNATFKVDTTVPGDSNGDGVVNEQDANGGKSVVAIPEATDADGNTINADDLKDGVQVKVTLPAGTQEGDKVYLTLTPEGKASIAIEPPYEVKAEDLNGERTVDITIPKDTLPKDAESGKTLDGNFTVTAQVKDAAGNTSQPSDKASFTVDTVEISGKPGVTIPEMDNNSVNASEFATAQGVDIKVTLPEGTQAGDTLTVTVSADGKAPITITKKLTAEDLSTTDGLTIHIPASKESNQANSFPVKADGSYTVVAKVSDGTTTVESEPASLVIDATVPGDSNGDGVVNEQDANGGKPVVAIPEATDADGNTINADDLKDGVQVNVTLPKGTQVGDTVTLTVKPENGEAFTVPYTVKEGDDVSGNGTPVSVTIPKQHNGQDLDGAYTVTAVVTDKAGNSSASSDKAKFTVDATVPGDTNGNGVIDEQDTNSGKPVVSIPEAEDGVNADELKDGVQVQVTLPQGTKVGDTVTLTVKADDGTEKEVTYTVKQSDDVNGATPVEIPIAKDNLPKDADNSVDGAYTVTAKVTDPAGNSSKDSDPVNFKVDTTVPGDTTGDGIADDKDVNGGKPVVAIPEATQEDGYTINAKELADGDGVQVEVTLPQGTQVGDTVTLTVTPNEGQSFEVTHEVKSSDDLTGTDPVTITIPKQHNGQDLDGAYTVTTVVTDKAGNSSATSAEAKFTVDATVPGDTTGDGVADDKDVNKGKPTVTIPEATEADNHIVNAKDFKDGVQVQVTLPKGTEAGDTVTLTVTPKEGQSFEVPYTVKGTDDVTGSGSVTVDIPTTKFPSNPDGDYTVTAVVTDAAGNSSAMSDAANFTIDITAPGDTNPAVPGVEEAPEVSIPEADNGVNDTEWNGGENQEGAGIQVKVTLPNGTQAGDTVTLTVTNADDKTTVFTTEPYQVKESDLTNGATITIPTSSKLTDGDYHVTALVTDQVGNAGKASEPADFTLDTTATGKPIIEGFVSDNNPQDKIITRNEVAEDGSVQVKVTLPDDVKAGDVLYITPITTPKENGVEDQPVVGEQIAHTISDAEASSKSAIVSVPTGVDAEKEGVLFVAANILDKAGNDSKASNLVKINVNRALEGKPKIVYTSDADQNGVLMGDEIANNVVSVKVNLPTVNAGDDVSITINGDNTYTVDLSGDTKVIKHGDKTYKLTTEDVNDKTEYTTTIDDVAVEDDATSITSSIVVTPTSGEKTEATQSIQIDRNQPGGTTDADSDGKGDGKPSITIPEASNPSLDKDGKISAAELSDADGVVINVTVPAGTEAGDIIVIKDNDSEIYTFTIPAGTTISTDPIAVTVPKDKFTDGETYNITASVKEPYSKGARESEDSDQVTFTVDTTVPGDSDGDNKPDNAGKPVVTLPDGVKDGVNVKELSDGIKVQVTLPKGTQEGDTVILTVKADDGTEQEVTYTVKQGDDVNGATPVEIPIAKDNLPKATDNAVDGNYTVTAKVTDPAGNSSKDSDPVNFKVDTTVPGDSNGDGVVNEQDANGKPVVAIPEATQEDGYTINAQDLTDGIQVNVTLPQGTQIGDTVTLTVEPENGDAFTVTYTVQLGDDVSGSGKPVSVTIPKQHKDKDLDGAYTVTAVVTDAVGNSSVTSDKAKFTVDATVPGDTSGDGVADDDGKPVVTIPENANGGVNATEFNDKGVQVNVTLPKGTQVGDTVTLTVKPASGNEFTVTYPVKDTDNVTGSGSVTVDIPTAKFPSNPDGAYTVTAKVTDPAGNSSKVSTPANFTVDTTVPGDSNGDGVADGNGKPVIESIPEATEADGYSINATEFSNGIEVQVRLPQGTQVDDTVTLTLQPQTGNTITVDYKVQSGDLSGTAPIVTIPVEKAKFPEQADGEYTVTAQVKDPAGNNSLVSEGKTFTIDTQAPTVTQPVAKQDGSVVITLPDDADKVTVTVQPEGETKPRDITLTKGDDGSWTSSDPAVVPNVSNGSTTTTIPNDKVTDGSEVTVSAQDKAGNSHSVSVNAVDVNDAPVLTIKPEDIVETGFTKGQATAGKLIATVTATDPDKTDTVTIKLLNNDDGYFVLDSGTGEISLTVKGAAFVNEGNNLPSIQVKAIDNRYLASEVETVNIADTIDTSNTLTITSNDGESVTGTTDPLSTVEIRNANNEVVGRGAADSDGRFTIKLTHEEVVSLGKENANQDIQADHNGDGELETYHTDEEGNYRYTVDSPIKTGETLTVTSTNSYDNRATQQSETPDEIVPSAPVIEINEQGTVISGIAEPGSTIVLQVTSKDGQTTQKVAIDKNDQPIIANEKGEFTIELKEPLIGKETITATAKDKADHTSTPSDSITAPYFNNDLRDVEIGLRNDAGVSGSDNITNDGGLKLVGDDSAMITKVEYKDAEGNYQTVPYVGGVYILPEGEYTAGTIRITQQDKDGAIKYSTNAEKFVIDTTAPNAATAVNDQDGNVTITLPSDAPKGDYVEVMVGNKKVTLTSDGNNGWTSSDTTLVPTPRDNEVTILHTVAQSGTGVSVQSFDIAGNKADKDSDNTLIDRNKITVALEHPEVNSNLMNDSGTTMVLNTAELEASGSPSNVTVKIYLPDSAKVGDFVEFPFGSSTLQSAVKQTDIDNRYFEVKADFPMNFALSQGENKYPVKLYQSDKTTVKSESEPLLIYVDKLTPDTPVVTSETGGKVSITLPTGARSNFDPSTSIGTQAEVGDWVIITAGDQSVKLTKTANNGWEKSTEADWITINGNTATIPTNIEKFPYGTTVTAQAFDKAGNQSEQGVGHVVKDPLKFTDFKVNNQDLDTSTPNIVDTNQKAIYYTATVEGQEAEEALIRVRLMKGDQQVEVHYLDISSDSQTYKGAFNNLSADYEQYKVIADIVHQDKSTGFNDVNLPERSVDVMVDNVVPQLDFSKITSSVLDGPNKKPNSVTIVATDGSHTLKDGNTTVSGAAEMTMKLDFGNAQSDKQRIITDKLGNKVVVYNPKLDWMMRKDDDDDTSRDQYHNDHAQGWGFDTKTAVMYNQDKALFYKWNGDNEAADIIVSGMSRTDEWWSYYNRRGWIGAENTGSSATLTNKTMTQFIMDTLGGGNDYISAPAIAGNVVIRTNDGDDMITTMNLQGRYDYYIGLGYSRPNVDGSNQIYMGDGNDTFEVTGTAKDTEDPNKAGAVRDEMKYASLYATNAKIDMGAGNDKVSIKWNVFTGSQQESGNYFNLGEGDDTMTVGGNVLGQLRENSYEGSTIINLGSGNDTLSLAKIERESNYSSPLVLITSKESANVTIGNVKEAQLSMMMGDGEDKVTISNDLILSGQKSDWISQVFLHNDEYARQGIERYKNFYDQALKDQINSSLVRAIDLIATDSQDRSATGGRDVVGADRVATSTSERITEIIDVLDLGDGQNTLSVTGKMFGVNYFGGKDVDTIQSGVTENSRFWLGLGEDSVELAQMSNSAIYAGAGEDRITVGGIAKQEGRGSIISAEDGNDTIIINKLNPSVALEADKSWIFGGNGDDTITINGDLFGTGNQIFGDAGNDAITISGNIRGYNNLIDGGAGNDTITLDGEILKDLGGKFEIRGGDGNDTISVGNISTEDNVSIFAGNGNDIVTIKNVKGDNDHIIDLGEDVNKTDYDILSIEGSQSEGYNNQFSIGGRPSEHTQIWGAEEIRFTGTGVTVKIESGNLVNNNTGPSPAGKDELFIRNDGGDATNKVVLSGSGWTKSHTEEHSFNGVSYQNVDVYRHSSSDDILYIQQGVTVI